LNSADGYKKIQVKEQKPSKDVKISKKSGKSKHSKKSKEHKHKKNKKENEVDAQTSKDFMEDVVSLNKFKKKGGGYPN
jgi:hypothetical protein